MTPLHKCGLWRLSYLGLILPALFPNPSSALQSETVRSGEVAARLVTSVETAAPGERFFVGVRFEMDPGWHIYWRNPGDTGRTTYIDWELPVGVEIGDLHWPHPEVYRNQHLVDYVYSGSATLYAEITLPEDWEPGKPLSLSASADWLMCKEICIPGKASLALEIPTGQETSTDTDEEEALRETASLWPGKADDVTFSLRSKSEQLQLIAEGISPEQALADGLWFFSINPIVATGADQEWFRENGKLVLNLKQSEYEDKIPESLNGVWVNPEGWESIDKRPALAVNATYENNAMLLSSTKSGGDSSASTETSGNLVSLLLLAFGGGLILNLMPCVFPVLGIKIMGFVQQGGQSRGKVVSHGLLFTAGVLVSFWALAGVLLALRAGGAELGWGFQLQSPAFVFGIAAFLLLFALNLSGLFEIGFRVAAAGGKLEGKKGFGGSFLSGILATIVATPCSAPFLATALAGALTLPAATSFLTFTVIALGLAAPYLLLSAFPSLLRKMPRPGAWMETFKQALAFPLYATVGWLMYVFAGQVDGDNLLNGFFALTLLAVAAWLYGKYGAPHRTSTVRRIGVSAAVFTFAAGIALGLPSKKEINWMTWTPKTVETLREENRWIYVDYTARWCATCQVNKKVVFSSDKVLDFISRNDVALLRADWTNEDPAITRSLESFGKAAVPVNLVYRPGAEEPVVLPETLTPGIVLRAFEE